MPQVRKIIVSDNDQIFLASCQNAFALRGMQTVPVPKHGRLLWDAIEKERPALVVCNIFMAYCNPYHGAAESKHGNGSGVCRSVRVRQ